MVKKISRKIQGYYAFKPRSLGRGGNKDPELNHTDGVDRNKGACRVETRKYGRNKSKCFVHEIEKIYHFEGFKRVKRSIIK